MSEVYWCSLFVWGTFLLFVLKEWRDFDELE